MKWLRKHWIQARSNWRIFFFSRDTRHSMMSARGLKKELDFFHKQWKVRKRMWDGMSVAQSKFLSECMLTSSEAFSDWQILNNEPWKLPWSERGLEEGSVVKNIIFRIAIVSNQLTKSKSRYQFFYEYFLLTFFLNAIILNCTVGGIVYICVPDNNTA